jgi:hypothetical protein
MNSFLHALMRVNLPALSVKNAQPKSGGGDTRSQGPFGMILTFRTYGLSLAGRRA